MNKGHRTIALYGYAGAGKDEVGAILVAAHGFHRRAKGDLVRSAALGIDPLIRSGGSDVEPLSVVVERDGWERAKRNPMVRLFLQNLADVPVGVTGVDFWDDALWREIWDERSYKPFDVVITRISHCSEAQTVRDYGGKVVRVVRNGTGPVNDHPNEVALDSIEPDDVIMNNGTLVDLRFEVDEMLNGWGWLEGS